MASTNSRSKIIAVAVTILILPQLSCDSGLTPEAAGLGYFPMAVGNRWVYSLSNIDFVQFYEIVGTTRVGAHDYFIFEIRATLGTQADSLFFREDASGRIYTNFLGEDVLYIDFTREVGKQWHSFNEYVGVIEKKDFAIAVPAGSFEHCTEVFFDYPPAIDDEIWQVYAPGVGLVETRGQIGSLQLNSAVVNGVEIL
jgi:hypothetical protein